MTYSATPLSLASSWPCTPCPELPMLPVGLLIVLLVGLGPRRLQLRCRLRIFSCLDGGSSMTTRDRRLAGSCARRPS